MTVELNRWKDVNSSLTEQVNIMKTPVLPTLFQKCNAIPIKIQLKKPNLDMLTKKCKNNQENTEEEKLKRLLASKSLKYALSKTKVGLAH